MIFKDSVGFLLDEADFSKKKVGEELKTAEHCVPYSDGLKWWVEWFPAGNSAKYTNYISVFLAVNKAVFAKFEFKINVPLRAGQTECELKRSATHDFTKPESFGFRKFASHDTLRRFPALGKLVTCEVEFAFLGPLIRLSPCLAPYSDHGPSDFELVVGFRRVKVHKRFLSLISPVFHAMLSHDTAEAKFGKVKITDFDFETVKTAIDFCLGRKLEAQSVETVVGILRFADKYAIDTVTDQLSKIPRSNLSIDTFPTIVHYAYDCSDSDLFDECCAFFKEHQRLIRATEKFSQLPPSSVAHLLGTTFDLETQFDILRRAYTNGIYFILDPLEQPIIKSMSLDTFCDAVDYAWDCSRHNLKKACAKFFGGNSAAICELKTFLDLGPQITHGMMKLRFDLFLADR
uniref:BTB domain-containing protein n=1 Tax=Panagrellus redivivus TaxID=6233 RepID=A0A7E4VW38_PANRE